MSIPIQASTLNFFYHRLLHPRRDRMQATVAYIFNRTTGQVTWGASFSHDKLDQFKRVDGRGWACIHLSSTPRYLEVPPDSKREVVQEAIIGKLRQYRRDLERPKMIAEPTMENENEVKQ